MKSFVRSLFILFTVLCVAELAFANRQSIAIALGGADTVAADMTNATATGSVSVYSDGTVSVRGKGSLKIENVDAKTLYVTLNTKKYSHYYTCSLYKTDDASSINRVFVGKNRFIPGGDSIFGITSGSNLHSVTFEFDTHSLFTINSITFNQKPPFSFNVVRLLILFAAGAFIIAILKYRLFLREYAPDRSPANAYIAAALLVCVVFTGLSTVKAVGFDKYPFTKPMAEYDEYSQLFDAFIKGQTNLDIPFDPSAFAALDNPYDYYERREKLGGTGDLWDRAYHNGKLYCYFGAAPVLLIYMPIYLVSGYVPMAGTASFILTVAAIFALTAAFLAALRHYGIKPPALLVTSGLAALICGSLIFFLNAHPSMYYNAVLSGILFLSLTVSFSYRAADAGKPAWRTAYLVLAALSAVFTVGSRPTLLLFALMLAPLYIDLLFSKKRAVAEKLKNLAAFGVPLAVGAFAVMAYNIARFGSPFDFGNNYQLTFNDTSYNTVSLHKFFPAIYHYFLQMPAVTGMFPFLELNKVSLDVYREYTYTYGSFGVFALPASLGIFGIPSLRSDKAKKFTYVSAVAVAVAVAFFDMCKAGVHPRYVADIAFPLMFIGVLTLLELAQYASGLSERARRHVFFAVNTVFVLTVIVAAAFLFANEADNMYNLSPRLFGFFEKLFA